MNKQFFSTKCQFSLSSVILARLPVKINYAILILAMLLSSGCAYRFSNLAMTPPVGIKSIAIEAVYDTTQEVVPHELLWGEIQHSFAENGRLTITDQSKADALVRIHLSSAAIKPTGNLSSTTVPTEPKIDPNNLPQPTNVKKLTRASSWTLDEAVAIYVTVEVWNLYTKKRIFNQTYAQSGTFKSYRSGDLSLLNTHFLLYEESLAAKFKELSRQIGDKVVADFLL